MYIVGYFEGATAESFQPLRAFETEARDYVANNYTQDAQGQPQNVAIRYQNQLIFDGRWVGLN